MHSLRVVIVCPLAVERRAAQRVVQRLRGAATMRATVVQCGLGASAVARAVYAIEGKQGAAPDLVVLFGLAGGIHTTPVTPRITGVCNSNSGNEHDVLRPPVSLWRTPVDRRSTLTTPATIVMVDAPVISPEAKQRLAKQTDAALVDCESHAFATACERHGFRWSVVRGVSDGPDVALPERSLAWIDDAGATRVGIVMRDAIKGAVPVGAVWALAMRTRSALHSAAAALMLLLRQDLLEQRDGLGAVPAAARSILLFGGVFDPPHRGHIDLAFAAMQAADCDHVVFIPASQAPLKSAAPVASDADRYDMLHAALVDERDCSISDVELAKFGVNYSIDTVRRIRARVGDAPELRLFIGADQAARFHQWRDATALVRESPPVVALREPFTARDALLDAMAPHWDREELVRWGQRIVDTSTITVSSTGLREVLARDGPACDIAERFVPDAARAIIRERNLYKQAGAATAPAAQRAESAPPSNR